MTFDSGEQPRQPGPEDVPATGDSGDTGDTGGTGQEAESDGKWDIGALRSGAAVCLVFAVPLQIAAQLAGRDSGLSFLLRLGSLGGFLVGAGVAAWTQQRRLPLAHALVTAIGTFAAVQICFVLARAIVGNDLRLGSALVNLTPVVGVGLVGGWLGQGLQRSGIRPRSLGSTNDRSSS